ncbi:hypothetical protein DTO207G8_103 [Paecilomyces variotii]|nr:hypothetical protein DTO169C6_1677 [Paecilomyces variotii]KAJ9260953.1 hypothetical protein DTO207G8_103 [Paecilomyces variotii]KAJ9266914.1 hypothetical protein DTO195F2_849 [Paecilomyces variotii]KAJ9352687.1 hypothetical protein DTO027B9_5695 [Paecilomyces variotii]
MEKNHIYQYSLLNALMDGVSETGISVSQFQQKGNQGLGTFSRMDGELLLLDGTVYKLRAGGDITVASPDEQIPYGVCTNFVPDDTKQVILADKTSIEEELEKFKPHTTNLFLSYRIKGHFKHIKARTVRGQEYKGQPLSELRDNQFVRDYENVDATIIGFRSPKSWQGFAVAGQHLHFISQDHAAGGHVLELSSDGEVTMSVAVASSIHIDLPRSDDFNKAKLTLDDAGIKRVEG